MSNQTIENTYVIGDVHGCFNTLKKLIDKLPKDANLIFVGDLCDRGRYSKEVITLVIQNNYQVILGNHDHYMLEHAIESINGIDNRWFREDYMGGKETMHSYKNDTATLHTHLTWLKTLPPYILLEGYFITHGFGLPYFQRRNSSTAHIGLLKNRISDEKDWGDDWEENWQNYKVINIFGHTDYDEVEVGSNYYGIDTGCAYGKKLTAIELGSMRIIEEKTDENDLNSQDKV